VSKEGINAKAQHLSRLSGIKVLLGIRGIRFFGR
jgi:hypothetical protein